MSTCTWLCTVQCPKAISYFKKMSGDELFCGGYSYPYFILWITLHKVDLTEKGSRRNDTSQNDTTKSNLLGVLMHLPGIKPNKPKEYSLCVMCFHVRLKALVVCLIAIEQRKKEKKDVQPAYVVTSRHGSTYRPFPFSSVTKLWYRISIV